MLSLENQNVWRERYRQEHPGWQPGTEVYAELVRAHLRPGSRVLDLGCGRGGLVEQLAGEGFDPGRFVGVDPDWLSLAAHRLENMPRVQAFSAALPFAGSRFDLIFASWLLEHLPEPEIDLRQIGRLLRPGGVFVFITPNRRHPLSAANRFFGRWGRRQGQLVERFYGRVAADTFPTYYRANSAADLSRLAAAAGLQVKQVQAIADPTYLAFNGFFYRLACGVDSILPADRQIHLVGCLVR
jgi:SAM-dependent methyltransferase